jgi:hypothetical protein
MTRFIDSVTVTRTVVSAPYNDYLAPTVGDLFKLRRNALVLAPIAAPAAPYRSQKMAPPPAIKRKRAQALIAVLATFRYTNHI